MKQADYPKYIGGIHPNCDYHHGQIMPAKGIHCFQITRANRTHPEFADGTDSTYKHAPDLAYFHGRFYVQYLCNPCDEHSGAGYSVLASTNHIEEWKDYQISFPTYQIPAGTRTDEKGLTHVFSGETYAFMHQRMSFYRSSSNRMLLLGFYGWSENKYSTNWDNYGIGRVVRELYADGKLGPIYFICVNWQSGIQKEDLLYPEYDESEDAGFVHACKELLENSLYVQQWAEESGDRLPNIKIKHPGNGKTYQAFCWYHLDSDNIICLWKHSMTAYSRNGGKTFSTVKRSPSLVMSGQKIWGQKTSDQRYLLVYDPTLETEHRYPMCLVTSEDGIEFSHMRLVHGEVPAKRFPGFWKDFGPQYVRGMTEGILENETEIEGAEKTEIGKFSVGKNAYVVYSVNKEDIWIAELPIPVLDETEATIDESFTDTTAFSNWNVYSPAWAKVQLSENGTLNIFDEDRYDYAVVERMLAPTTALVVEFTITALQDEFGELCIELLSKTGQTACRLVFRPDGWIYARTVIELKVAQYQPGMQYQIRMDVNCKTFDYTLQINEEKWLDEFGCEKRWAFTSAVDEIVAFRLRTGDERKFPDLATNPELTPAYPLEGADEKTDCAKYELVSFSYQNRSER